MVVQKSDVVTNLSAKIKSSLGFYVADFTGLTVEKVTALRNTFRSKGMYVKVAKNTLIKRALHENDINGLDAHFVGPTMIIFSDAEDPLAPAKVFVDFHKTNEKLLSLKTIQIDGQAYPGTQLVTLSKMPGKRELQAQVISLAMGPSAVLIGLFKGPGVKLAGQVKALVERLEGAE